MIKLDEFLEIIERWRECFEIDDEYYFKAIEMCSKVPRWDEKLVYKYLIRFLDLYGVYNTHKANLEKLAKIINNYNNLLKQFNNTDLLRLDLDKYRNNIINLFEEIDNKVKYLGLTSTSKILHLLKPEVFVMWDKEIAKLYNKRNNTEGYFEFLKICKNELEKLLEELRKHGIKNPEDKLRKRYRKPLTKLIDEYNWFKVHQQNKQMLKLCNELFSVKFTEILNELK